MDSHGFRSKKHCATKSPPEPVFFIDRSLGKRVIAEALRKAGAIVEVHDDHFPHDAKDEDWLRKIGRSGWVVLTKDSRIRYRNLETAALTASKVRTFVLTSKDMSGQEMADVFTRALPKMKRLATKYRRPFIAKVFRDGSVSIWKIFEQER